MKYEFLEHTADIKFRTRGKSLDECFENVILAFSEVISKGNKINSTQTKIIDVKGIDKKSLLYNFLEELIYLVEKGFVVGSGKVVIKGNFLKAKLSGDSIENYNGLREVKAATYAEMRISKKDSKRWLVQAVLDV